MYRSKTPASLVTLCLARMPLARVRRVSRRFWTARVPGHQVCVANHTVHALVICQLRDLDLVLSTLLADRTWQPDETISVHPVTVARGEYDDYNVITELGR